MYALRGRAAGGAAHGLSMGQRVVPSHAPEPNALAGPVLAIRSGRPEGQNSMIYVRFCAQYKLSLMFL